MLSYRNIACFIIKPSYMFMIMLSYLGKPGDQVLTVGVFRPEFVFWTPFGPGNLEYSEMSLENGEAGRERIEVWNIRFKMALFQIYLDSSFYGVAWDIWGCEIFGRSWRWKESQRLEESNRQIGNTNSNFLQLFTESQLNFGFFRFWIEGKRFSKI